MSVVEIKTKEPNPAMVNQCKVMLKDAESGKIQSMIGVIVYDAGTTSDFWVPAPKVYHCNLLSDRIIGSLEGIKHQMLSKRYDSG